MRVPEGWKLVPIKPTKEMKAACRVAGKAQVWDDMLSATPTPPAQEDEPVAFLDKREGEEQTKISVHVYTDGCKNLPEGVTKLYARP